MSTYAAPVSVLEPAVLGAFKNTPICVTPTRPVAHLQGRKKGEQLHITQFKVVNVDGSFFTTHDMERMGLHPTDAFALRDLCEDKLPLIHTLYFPRGMYDKVFMPGCCHTDDDGRVHILFGVSGSTR